MRDDTHRTPEISVYNTLSRRELLSQKLRLPKVVRVVSKGLRREGCSRKKKEGLDKQFSLFCCPADSKICLPLSRAPAKLKAALLRLVLIRAPVTCCHVWILSGNVTFGGSDSRSTTAIECRARMRSRTQYWPRAAAGPAKDRSVDKVNLKVYHSTGDPANVGRTADQVAHEGDRLLP